MTNAYTWSFTTGVAPDTTPPTVSSTGPVAGAIGVAFNTLITASFSEPMDPLSITTANFTLACPSGNPIAGTVGYAVSGNVATFTPVSNLPASTSCTATISTGVQDVAHNAMASAYTWSFTTGVAPDTTPPTVSSTSPLGNASGVAVNALISASFSEPMDPLTISTANFTLACPSGNPIAGTVGYAVNGNVATFTPASSLPASTSCTATINTGVQDVAHNAMASAYTWSFTTGVAPDTTPPTVSSTSPLASAGGVAVNALITASFSEPMDPLTISTASFTLACPAGTPIAGTVGYAVSGNVATFTPVSNLPASTSCTATISTGVQDVAHNAMASAYTWSFTTGVAPDTTPPTVSSTNPGDGAVGVCVNKTVNVTFSEPMDPLTITTATFSLAVTAGASVMGVVSYDAATNIATFRPATALTGTPATNYTATIKGGASGVKDLAGNALVFDQSTTFTTNSSTCTTAPALGAAASFGAFGGSATLTNDGLATVINGDIGVNAASTTITGLHDSGGNVYTITTNNNGAVNGSIYTLTAPPGSVPGQAESLAQAAALAAFNSISPANLAGGIDVSSVAQCPSCGGLGDGADELAGRTLPPGIFRSAIGTYDIGGAARTQASLTLDAGGDANAVWVFQTTPGTGTLTVGLTGPATPAVPIKVLLINGAQSKNVFWFVPAGATIGTGSTVAGTMLANASITMSTTGGSPPTAVVTTINGRALALTAAVTMTNTVINVPPP
jgi:Ice-binding-like/Bacterial Ig-like domain